MLFPFVTIGFISLNKLKQQQWSPYDLAEITVIYPSQTTIELAWVLQLFEYGKYNAIYRFLHVKIFHYYTCKV